MSKLFLKRHTKIFIWIVVLLAGLLLFPVLYEKYKIYEFISLIESDPYYVTDEITGHGHTPNYRSAIPWPEGDSIIKQTNNFGFVETGNTLVEKPDSMFRILITGDSHIDGVVSTNESFPNVLETELNKFPNAKKAEVINAGVGFYSFQNYDGVIKKYSKLKPDLFIVTVYTGNDFIEGYLYEKENQSALTSLQTFWYRLKKGYFQWQTNAASTQSTNQILFFKTFPDKKEKALLIAQQQFLEIKKQCTDNGTALLIVLLPSKLESEAEFKEKVLGKSKWSEAEININKELSSSLETWLKKQEIHCINVTSQFETIERKLFWDTDEHLNKTGHLFLARIVLDKYNSDDTE